MARLWARFPHCLRVAAQLRAEPDNLPACRWVTRAGAAAALRWGDYHLHSRPVVVASVSSGPVAGWREVRWADVMNEHLHSLQKGSVSAALRRSGLLALLLMFAACGPSTYQRSYNRDLYRRLAAVDTSDGVSQEEAIAIAWVYFLSHLGMCGAPQEPVLRGDTWYSTLLVGVAGDPTPEKLEVDADDGGVRLSNTPSYEDLEALRREIAARGGID